MTSSLGFKARAGSFIRAWLKILVLISNLELVLGLYRDVEEVKTTQLKPGMLK